MCDYQESATTGQTHGQTDRLTDRHRTKLSVCATMLRRRHNNAAITAWRYIARFQDGKNTVLNYSRHLMVSTTAMLLMSSRGSAGVTLPLEFRINFQVFSRVKCNITVISLLLGKYTRTFAPRFPEIPEMLYFSPPSASGNITSQGFQGTEGQMFWHMKYEISVWYSTV